jgi:hypothetical protein
MIREIRGFPHFLLKIYTTDGDRSAVDGHG